MSADYGISNELHRINVKLTQALCFQQDLVAKLNRQIYNLKDDLSKSQQHVYSLQQLQQQQQHIIPGPTNFFGQGQSSFAPTALFGGFGSTAPHHRPMNYDGPIIEHKMAGSLLSPSKKAGCPFSELNGNAPLKMSDLPQPSKKNASKRAPLSSPPAKPTQKRPSHRPTPEKLKGSQAGGVIEKESDRNPLKPKAVPSLSLFELKCADWKVSEEVPNTAACRPLLTAIFQISKGNVSMLQASITWLIKNVAICRNTLLQTETRMAEAFEVAQNIEMWLQYNERFVKKKGTLPMEMNQAIQVLCSAALFNERMMNTDLVRRVLPSIGGRKRLKSTKEFNKQLIDKEKPFSWPKRKVRKDSIWPLVCQFVRRKICWNDKYTKVDTNYSRKIKCREPVIESLEGGGFQLAGWRVIEREMRMWYEETKLSDVLKLVVNSEEWKQMKVEYPSVSICRSSLALALCPSVRKPSFRSCVNEKMSALSYLLEDFYKVINDNTVLRKRIEECQCTRHRSARDMRAMNCSPPPLWHEELRCLPSKFCAMSTCEKKEQLYLRVGDAEPPKLRDKCCTKSACANCGFERKMGLGALDCTAFKDCEELMEVTLWEKAARNGDRFQREPTRYIGADRKTVAEVYTILSDDVAPVALEHLGEAQWWKANVDRKVKTLGKDELLIFTDFSATPEFIAKEVGNCHEAEHCVIDVIVVLDDPRTVLVEKDGVFTEKRINSCTYWAFLGPTDGKGKKNDHRFHREALHCVIDFHKKKALQQSREIKVVTLLSDNCSGQYKSQYNMGDVAWFSERHPGVRMEHCYAPVFEFKGVHDGFGKTVKWKFKEAELKGRRIPNAEEAYAYLFEKYAGRPTDWDIVEAERSPKLLQRGPFTMTEVCVGYIADTKDEVDSVQQKFGGDHVLLCNRVCVPRTVGDKAAEGLTDVYSVRGKQESACEKDSHHLWELELSARVCFCAVCTSRDTNALPCPYADIRGIRNIVVDDKANDLNWVKEQRAKRAVALHFRKKKLTGYVNMTRMRDELRLLGKEFPANAKRIDLAYIFLSMQNANAESEEEQLLAALEEEVQNPSNPSLDDDAPDDEDAQELPISEEDAPTDIDLLLLNDIEAEEECNDYSISDDELKLMTDFSSLTDKVLEFLLFQRRLPTQGTRAEQEEQLREAVRPF